MTRALLLPHPRARMGLHEHRAQRYAREQRRALVALLGLGGVDLDPAQVLRADEAVLTRADQPERRAVVAVERPAIEVLRDQHVVRQGVLDRDDRAVAVEADEPEVRDRRAGRERGLDERG